MFKNITRVVWILSIVSLLTDVAGEMLYPVMPVYLKSIGFSVLMIGLLEGVAEATAGLSKGYFGKMSDNIGRRVPFVQLGYLLSSFSKPLLALFLNPFWVLFARSVDRFGKGIRTGARDAILSDEASPESKGKIFGFHRMLDTFGAVLGPLCSLIYLYYFPENYITLFYLAFIPGIIAVVASFLLRESKSTLIIKKQRTSLLSFLKYWNEAPTNYRNLVIGLLLFTLANSSDVFLLLKAKQAGLSDVWVIGIYIFYNLVYALFSFPIGIMADKLGLKNIYVFGLLMFAVVYFGMSISNSIVMFSILFFIYGLYAAATEGVSKALISNISDKKDTATAIGTYAAFQSICTMLASTIAGLIWFKFGSQTIFILTGIITLSVAFYFTFFIKLNVNTKI